MSDIEKLIERLFADLVIDKPGYDALMRAADAQARLVAPLPAEVAEEARYLRMLAKAAVPDLPHVTLPDSLRDIADLLESLARENARLAAENAELREEVGALGRTMCDLNDALLPLEAERDRLAAENAELRMTLNAERDNRSDNGDPMLIDRLRAELETARAALLELSQLGGGRSEGNWIAQRALDALGAWKVEIDIRLALEVERDRLRAELASYKAATKLVVEYDRQQDKLDAKKGGA